MPRRSRSRVPQWVWNTAGTIFVWLIIAGLVIKAILLLAMAFAVGWAALVVIAAFSRWLSRAPSTMTIEPDDEGLREF